MTGLPGASSRRAFGAPAPLVIAALAPIVPLVVALLARRSPQWVPDLDLALTELRVRDVGTGDTPLVGLPGRIGDLSRQGSHPGPISFYLLAPTYRLLGGSTSALQVATVVVHVAAVATTVVFVARTAGARWALAAGGGLMLLVAGFGPNLFTEPWNPHLPVLWWPAFLAACLAALRGDRPALIAAVVSGTICAQTHLSYLGAVGVLTTLTLAVAAARPKPPEPRRGRVAWVVAALALGALLWLPPLVDQVRHDPGNGTLLVEHLLHPPEAPLGWRAGTRLVLERFDLVHLAASALGEPGRLSGSYPTGAQAWRGALLLVGLAIGLGLGARRRPTGASWAAGWLTVAATALALLSVSRIFGPPWGYLLLFVWTIGLVGALAAVALASERMGRARRLAGPILAVVALALSARAVVAASDAGPSNPVVSRTVLALVEELEDELDPDQRYLVTWTDAIHVGGHGYGVVLELDRRGFDVVVDEGFAVPFGRHRTPASGPVDARLVVASGAGVDAWASTPASRLLVAVDVRTPAELEEAARVEEELVALLRGAGLGELEPVIDENLLTLVFDPRLPEDARPLVHRLDELGARAAVLAVPVDAEPGGGVDGPRA